MEDFLNLENLDISQLDEGALELFGDKYLADASRVLATRILFPSDADMVQLAIALVVSRYTQKLLNGDFGDDKVIH